MGKSNSTSGAVNDGENNNPDKKAASVARPPRKCLGTSPV